MNFDLALNTNSWYNTVILVSVVAAGLDTLGLAIKGAIDFNEILDDYVSGLLKANKYDTETFKTVKLVFSSTLISTAIAITSIAYIFINYPGVHITVGLIILSLALNGLRAFQQERKECTNLLSQLSPQQADPASS
jgi:ABC-type Fe3+ transport system permease subunit